MRCLVTGATGDVGSKVVKRLIERGERPRIFVRDPEKAHALFGPKVEMCKGDSSDPASLKPAFESTDAVFLVNSGPEIPRRDQAAARAAREAGVKRVVKLSSLDVEQGLAIGAWHEKGEAAFRSSGIAFTFIRPSGFMSNLLAWAGSIKAEGAVRSSTGDGKRAFIHSDDIAAVAVEALTNARYEGQSLPITGPEALSFPEVTARIGAIIRKQLRFEAISDEEAGIRYAAATGAGPEETEAHVALWRAIREGQLGSVTDTVERILGRKPISLDKWLEENAAAFC